MKILSIGDIHGFDSWKKFVIDISNYDKVIFVGDYVDEYHLSNSTILNNLLDIIEFKNNYSDKVVLLLGNHDYQYAIRPPKMEILGHCSGYRADMHFDLYDVFHNNLKLFQFSYQYENYIWTHAGIHRGWYEHFLTEFKKVSDFEGTISDKLNLAFEFELDCLLDCGFKRKGHSKVGGPLWADKTETWDKPLKNYHQICGHTPTDKIIHHEIAKYNSSVTYIDSLPDYCYILDI